MAPSDEELVGVPPGGTGGGASAYAALVLDAKPIGYWRLGDEETSLTARDEVGGRDADVIGGGVGLKLAQPSLLSGDPNGSMLFEAAPSRLHVADGFRFAGTAAFSIEIWLQVITPPDMASRFVVSATGATGQASYRLFYNVVPGFQFERRNSAGQTGGVSAGVAPALGVTTHVVASYDGQSMRIYVDGVLADESDWLLSIDDVASELNFGAQSANDLTNTRGYLDEIAIYDRALHPSEVSAHHAAGSPAP